MCEGPEKVHDGSGDYIIGVLTDDDDDDDGLSLISHCDVQLSVLQSRKDHSLRRLRARMFEGKLMVKHMTEAPHR